MVTIDKIFIRDADHYKRDFDIVGHAIKQSAIYLNLQTGRPLEECIEFVKNYTSENGTKPIKPMELKTVVRKQNGDRGLKKVSIDKVLSATLKMDATLSPNLCAYENRDVLQSHTGEFIDGEMERRAIVKHEAFEAKMMGNTQLALNKGDEQNTIKRGINSISGARVSAHNPLTHKTVHSTLTSICRVITGYSNASTEKMMSGNRHYYNVEVTRNHILSMLSNVDYDKVKTVVAKYNLNIPTAKDIDDLIHYSMDLYYFNREECAKLTRFVNTLDPIQRCIVAYTGDLYHVRKFNDQFIRTMLDRLMEKPTNMVDNPDAYIKAMNSDVKALMGFICIDITKGNKLDDVLANEENKIYYASMLAHLTEVFNDYVELFDALFVNDSMPHEVYAFPDSQRRSVVGGDTDSTMFTVQEWVTWYFGKLLFTDEAYKLSNLIIFINIQVTAHWFAHTSRYMGVRDRDLYRLTMKNEYYFTIYLVANRAKHYLTLIAAQEGNIWKEPIIDAKGVALRNSRNSPIFNLRLHKHVKLLMEKIITDGSIDILDTLYLVARQEFDIKESLRKGETTYLSRLTINAPSAYKNGEANATYKQHIQWETVFAKRYGITEPLPYPTYKVNVDLDKALSFKKWIEETLDDEMRANFMKYMEKVGHSGKITNVLVPMSVCSTHFPEEFRNVVNDRKITVSLMEGFYILLEMLGFYYRNKKDSRLVSDEVNYEAFNKHYSEVPHEYSHEVLLGD